MNKKITIVIIMLALLPTFSPQIVTATTEPGEIYKGEESIFYRNVTIFAPAVASTETGYIGVISTITVTIQSNGSGRVFVDTLPLTEIDMQGSARLAVNVASALVTSDVNCEVDPSEFDYFFVVRTDSPIIGGPSAGAAMTVATISLLNNWPMNNKTIMTGMINPDGSIGPIGGISQKVDAADSVGATHFLIPYGQRTYTEYVTTTENSNGWVRTVTRPVTVDVADYAMENYGMTVTEVKDINEALENFTGHRFFLKESGTPITTEEYLEAMEPLASTLLEDANDSLNNASSKFDISGIPKKPYNYKGYVQNQLDTSESTLEKSKDNYNENLYYSSISRSFQSLIYSRFVIYACDYFESEEDTFLEDLLSDVEQYYIDASQQAKDAKITGYISLQTVGIAQSRASDAKTYLDDAKDLFENSSLASYLDVLDFLYNLAFVVERSNSIGWWLKIGTYFNETGSLDSTTIENTALEYIEDATQSILYSEILLSEIGTSSSYLTEAGELLTTSRNNLDNGYPAAALFEALEATVRANLAIEIIGAEAIDKIQPAKEIASSKIDASRTQGIEPILAVSYYEYAESLDNETDYESALVNYKFSAMIAGALSFTNTTAGSTESRYFGEINIEKKSNGYWFLDDIEILIILLALVGVAGVGLGLVIAGFTSEKEKRYGQKEVTIQNTQQYPTQPPQPRQPRFSFGETPRSVKEYYKKNK